MTPPLPFHVVLYHPEIPQNTGNIGRICVCTGAILHLIKPIGFSLEERYVRRAGLDYWKHLPLRVHEGWEPYLLAERPDKMYFITTKASQAIWHCPFEPGCTLVFGSESSGFPPEIYQEYGDRLYIIPMLGEHYRSHNLANAVAIALHEATRSLFLQGAQP